MDITRLLKPTSSKKFIIDTGLALMLRIVSAGSTFGVAALVARELGAQESGRFFLCLSMMTILGVVLRFGLDGVILRMGAAYRACGQIEIAKSIFYLAIVIVSGFGMTAWAIILLFNGFIASNIFHDSGMVSVLREMAPIAIFLPISWIVAEAHRAAGRIILYQWISASGVPMIMVGILLVAGKCNSQWVARAYTLTTIVVFLLAFGYWILLEGLNLRLSTGGHLSAFLRLGPSFLGIGLVSMINQQGASIVLGILAAESQVAVYHVAARTATLVTFLVVATNTVIAPEFARLHALKDIRGLERVAKRSSALVTFGSLPAVLFLMIFSENVMRFFGDEFASGSLVLRILVLGQLANALAGCVGMVLTMTSKERLAMVVSIGSLIITAILWLAFIPTSGASGAALGSVLGMFIGNTAGMVAVKRSLGFWIYPAWSAKLEPVK
ncbi:MAG: polysaccharide biosynthesis C-terminal domain-containing protein [Acidobacteria bacterium]|nr:polysaccharide biosynthesis C-terminal domain-containing protein [Acidobacteriota bacterium]